MNQTPQGIVQNLENINVTLRRKLEIAEATIPDLNCQLQQLAMLGGLDNLVIAGRVIQIQPYATGLGPIDSGQVHQAVLLLPRGLGVMVWDTEVFSLLQKTLGFETGIITGFLPFQECSNLIKALLLSQVQPLMAELNRAVRMLRT